MIILTQGKSKTLRIGEILLHQGWIKPHELQAALDLQKEDSSKPLIGKILIHYGFISKNILYRALAMQFGKQFIELSKVKIQKQALQVVEKNLAVKYGMMPIMLEEGMLYIAIPDPLDRDVCSMLQQLPGVKSIEVAIAVPEDIHGSINRYYGSRLDRLKMHFKEKAMSVLRYFSIKEMASF